MRLSSILTVGLIGFCFQLFAQRDSSSVAKGPIHYFNNFLAGGLLGESEQGSGLSLSTTHGIRFRLFALGASVGFDSYLDWKTLPVYGSLSFDFGTVKQNAFFIQFDAGYSKGWDIKKEEWPIYNVTGGAMISSTLGYRVTTKKINIYMAAGYKFQKINYSYNPTPWITGQTESKISIEEDINRLVIRIGFGLH